MEILKVGDVIEWNFKDKRFKNYPDFLKDKIFTAKISIIDYENNCYGVYASYGQDYIYFDECKKIK